MTSKETLKLRANIRNWILLFVILLLISGITAFPLRWELSILNSLSTFMPGELKSWIEKVNSAMIETDEHFPFLFYGTDWLAFAHLVIAVAFIGPLRDPVKNIWTIEFGMIACVMVLPLALIAGPIRGIPFFWQLIDCSFGIFGFIPLWLIRNKIKQLEKLKATQINTSK